MEARGHGGQRGDRGHMEERGHRGKKKGTWDTGQLEDMIPLRSSQNVQDQYS